MSDQGYLNERLETPKELAKRVGVSEGKIRHLLRTKQLEHVMIGSRVHIPEGAFRRFLSVRTVMPCPDETRGQDCGGWRSGNAFTSFGANTAAAASARLARQIANKLKSSSRNGCTAEDADPAQVIPLRSS
jgi:excisionase family DNA binding protein